MVSHRQMLYAPFVAGHQEDYVPSLIVLSPYNGGTGEQTPAYHLFRSLFQRHKEHHYATVRKRLTIILKEHEILLLRFTSLLQAIVKLFIQIGGFKSCRVRLTFSPKNWERTNHLCIYRAS